MGCAFDSSMSNPEMYGQSCFSSSFSPLPHSPLFSDATIHVLGTFEKSSSSVCGGFISPGLCFDRIATVPALTAAHAAVMGTI